MSRPQAAPEQLVSDDEDIVIGEAVALNVRPAGFMLRALSSLIDAVVAVIALVLVMQVVSVVIFETGLYRLFDSAMVSALYIVLVVACTIGIPVTIETITNGRSLGRLIVGLRIVRDDGGATGFRHAFIRGLTGFFEFFMTGGGAAVLVGMLNPRSKRIGDLLAGTYAQYERGVSLPVRTLEIPESLRTWAYMADVARIPDQLSRRIYDYFDQYAMLEPAARKALAESLGREAMAYVNPVPPVDADTFLRGVVVLRRERELARLAGRDHRRRQLAPALEQMPFGFPDRG